MRRLVLLLALVVGCTSSPDGFTCIDNAQCESQQVLGICESTGHCSFPDPTCNSGRRYGEQAAATLAEACVPVDDEPTGESSATAATGASSSSGSTSALPTSEASSSSSTTTQISTGAETAGIGCGNGVVEPGEECDGADLGERPTCGDHQRFPGDRPLECLECDYRLTVCDAHCGDGTISDNYEQCDPLAMDPLNGRSCSDLPDFVAGRLGCDPTTCQYDTSACNG